MTLQTWPDVSATVPILVVSTIVGAFIGEAFDPMLRRVAAQGEIRMRTAIEVSLADTDWGVGQRFGEWWRREANGQPMDPRTQLICFGVGIALLTGLYSRWVEQVATAVVVSALAAVTAVALAFLILFFRHVIDGRGAVARLLVGVVLAVVAIFNGVALVFPPLQPGAAADVAAHGLFGAESVSFRFACFQAFGALLTFGAQFAAIAYATSCVSGVYYFGTGGRVWRLAFWAGRWSIGWSACVGVLLASGLAYGMTTGYLTAWFDQISSN